MEKFDSTPTPYNSEVVGDGNTGVESGDQNFDLTTETMPGEPAFEIQEDLFTPEIVDIVTTIPLDDP